MPHSSILTGMDAKDEVKRRLSVEEVVGDYVELKRAGRNLKALSPFSSEKTPSFMVSPEKQIWHDFSSNKGGDIFSFIMEVEGVDFREALEILARRANVDLSQYQRGDGSMAKKKKRMIAAHKAAAEFYHICLSRHAAALKYVKESRNFSVETIRTWQLGYSPEDGRSLLSFLKKKGFSEAELSGAGLITKRRGEWGDLFRGRVMIPLCDAQSQVVGFTARLLKDNPKAPKYFNTPQTPIYDKGRQVFGLHLAKAAMRKQDYAVVVEGNLDVIAAHQVGTDNVVACAGTALTADHLRVVSRLTPNVRLAFDGDKAGLAATERAIGLAQDIDVNLLVVTMPDDAKDPDELIQSDPDRWRAVLDTASDAVTWVLQRYESEYDKSTAEGKKQLSNRALAIVGRISDPVEREHHINALAESLSVSVSSLKEKLSRQKQPTKNRKPIKAEQVSPDYTGYEDDFLAINSLYPDVRDSLSHVQDGSLVTERRNAVLAGLRTLDSGTTLGVSAAHSLHIDEDYAKILLLTAEEKYSEFTPAAQLAEAMALARRIEKTANKKQLSTLTAKIREAEAAGKADEAAALLEQYQQLIHGE